MIKRIQEKLHKYKKWEPLAFFVGGFTFDAMLLHRIDDPLMLIHQASYLILAALIIAWDLFTEAGRGSVPTWFEKVWSYREGILHFILGTLLNVYTIFYFKSGSFWGSFIFLLILAVLLYVNEVRPPKISKHLLRNALFALCLVSYMNILVPIAVGSIGLLVFALALGVAALVHQGFLRFLKTRLEAEKLWVDIRLPFLGVLVLYSLLYVFKVLPPVPLSIKYIGIYRDIAKEGEHYKLATTKPRWKIWENGEQDFVARPGDKIYCYIQIFSPTRFKDQLFVRWKFKDPQNGWQSWDAIPLSIVGGREEGYRGYTVKSNYTPGTWRVSVETRDGREVGRIGVKVSALSEGELPPLNYEHR